MDADLDTLCTALYVAVDDELKTRPELARYRPVVEIAPKLSDAELVTLSVVQALLGFSSETRFLRFAKAHLWHLFPYVPNQSGYNKRLRAATGQLQALIRTVARQTTLWSDDLWMVDSTPGRVREISGDGQAQRALWLRRLRVLRQPLPLFLGTAAPPGHDASRVADHLRPRTPSSTSAKCSGTSWRSSPNCSTTAPARSSWPTRATAVPSSRNILADHGATLLDRPCG